MKKESINEVEIIDQNIINRKTQKVLAKEPWEIDNSKKESLKKTIQELLNLAEYAPYHYKIQEEYYTNNKLNSCVPWRFYVLDTEACRDLYSYVKDPNIKKDKIRDMLGAADALLMVTWLPHPSRKDVKDPTTERMYEPIPFEGNGMNMEHIAATSCAIQNVLIGASARKIPNYWSSGGKLRDKKIRDYLAIPLQEILLGAIFLFPEDAEKRDSTIITGAKRNEGKEQSTWSTWIHPNENKDH
jgi:nitroreductase